ncbi:MAG TPA: AI-2E family transporter [Candidatus Limnocylindrales bacterium]|nr:AI-2E family transporter [Candidatus Limnocylindrales bacterium]
MRSEIPLWTLRGMGLALGFLLVYTLVQIGIAAAGVLLLVFVAVLLAAGLEPMLGWLRARLPIVGRAGTIIVVYVTFFVTVVGLAFVVVPAAIGQAERIIADLPPVFAEARAWAENVRPAALATSLTALIDSVASGLKPPEAPNPDDVVEVGTTVAELVITLATLLTIVFFWLVERPRLQRYVLAFLPQDSRAGARSVWNDVEIRLGLWVRGQLTLMASIGVMTGIAYTLLGVPGALLLALIAAITEAIPIIGPLLGAIPAVLVAATVSPELALIVAGIYVILQFIEGNVLVPIVMRHAVGISPLLVLTSLLIGAAAGGFIGALLAVPIAASVEIILQRLQAREEPVAQDPSSIETEEDNDEEEATQGATELKKALSD